jgi:hypothetical protein
MGLVYGAVTNKITSADIDSISLTQASIVTAETGNLGPSGEYQIKVNHLNSGCDFTQVNIVLKDNIDWSYITFEMHTTGGSACWGFNHGNYSESGNLYSYDESAGDRIFESINSWELPQFQSHNRTVACDNDDNNFMRYNTSGPRVFAMKRRRNKNGSLAFISHGRACNNYGTTLIKNIRIW